MAFLDIPNVKIEGISASVPKFFKENLTDPLVADAEKIQKNTGINKRHLAGPGICTTDLCVDAAHKLISDLNWGIESIDCLVFVTQTPDYILPSSAPLLQNRLGLSQACFTLDISSGCSGYIYGLSTIASLMQSGGFKRGLLLVGDTISKLCSEEDKSTYPLFGDAGTATALSFDTSSANIKFYTGVDGSGKDAIIVQDGGYRNMCGPISLNRVDYGEGIVRSNVELTLEGMDVFSFGISKGPLSINQLLEKYDINKDEVDAFVFHQANLFMNEKVRKKLGLEEDKVPYSLQEFGNTSCATIPLTMVFALADKLKSQKMKLMACGFGVGLSWGSAYFETENLVIPELSYYE